MTEVTRRDAVFALGVSIAGAVASSRVGHAADHFGRDKQGGQAMSIERYEQTPSHAGIPLISYAVAHGDVAYIAGVTADPARLGDVKDQTRQILARIDVLLEKAGTNKSKLLSAQVWLTDMNLFAAHNDAWNEWVDPRNPPARACLLSPQLWRPGLLVEIMVTAAR
jgi:enamine deaminase RidA (YjgF/YER057c/UK114 family)